MDKQEKQLQAYQNWARQELGRAIDFTPALTEQGKFTPPIKAFGCRAGAAGPLPI